MLMLTLSYGIRKLKEGHELVTENDLSFLLPPPRHPIVLSYHRDHRSQSSFSPLPIVSRLFMYSIWRDSRGGQEGCRSRSLMLDGGITGSSSGDITHIVMMANVCFNLSVE